MQKQWQRTVAVVLSAWALPAWAGGYCSSQTPCANAGETCQGSYCVPSAKLCTGDSACQAWEKCDFTCPTGLSGGGSTSTGGGPVYADASSSSGDATAWISTDAGSSGGGSYDGMGGIPIPGDASSGPPMGADAFGPPPMDASFGPYDGGPVDPPPSTCPKSPGVCVPVLTKVPAQAGCDAFCKALVPCNLAFGSGSSSSGSSGGGGGTPPSDADASSGGIPTYPDATDWAPDVLASYDTNMPQIDAGAPDVTPGPEAQAQCVALCSVWVLDKVAPAELPVLEQCAATQAPNGCDAIQKNCETAAKAFMAAATTDDSWSLGLSMGDSTGTANSGGGGTKDGDASPVFANGDTQTAPGGADAAGAAQDLDATSGSDSAAVSDAGSTVGSDTAPAKSGCTAGTTSHGTSGLALLGLIAGALVLRRRRNA